MSSGAGRVFLVGAGPGAPDLITLRGAALLHEAEVVIYDYLVSPELLRLAPAGATLIYAGKKGGAESNPDQADINQMLVDQARAGRRVVRLKGGDPFIFGRGGEEAAALAAAGIAFEIVPGVTSATAAPAFAGIPLTHRERGSFVVFIPGHLDLAKNPDAELPWDDLARAVRGRGTIVLLMATARLRDLLTRLITGGLAPTTPAAAIQWAGTAAQQTVTATLASLADEVAVAGLGAPAVIVVGECAALRGELEWFEQMPLFGRRIIVTRTRGNAAGFASKLRALGADVIEFPTIATVPPASYHQLDGALARLQSFDWVIFTSATGVESFIARLRERGGDLRDLGAQLAAIGPATAARLAHYALRVAATPAEYRAEALANALGDQIQGRSFLLPRAEVAREVLPDTLRQRGAREVVVAPAYRTVAPTDDAAIARIQALIRAQAISLVTFTSSSTVTNFSQLIGEQARALDAAVIGPVTAATARESGFAVVATAAAYTVAGLLAAIREYCTRPAA